MAITESQRRDVYVQLEAVHGEQIADLLMQMLPYQANHELVTRSDMAATTTMLRGEMGELRGEMAELRGEMGELRAELRGEIVELRAEVRAEIAGLQRWGAGVVAANAVAVVTALLA